VLHAKKQGTCFVTATRAHEGATPAVTSLPTLITFAKASPRVATLATVVTFSGTSDTLSHAAKTSLDAFATRLATDNAVVLTGYAHNDRELAKRRAAVVGVYLTSRVKVRVTIKVATMTDRNEVSLRRN